MSREARQTVKWLIAAAAALMSGSISSAQNTNENNNNGPVVVPSKPVRQQAPPRMGGLGGVRSQPGVRSAAPRPIPTQTFGKPLANAPVIVNPNVTFPSTNQRVLQPSGLPGYQIVPVVGDGLTITGSYRDGPFTLNFSTGGLSKVLLPRDGYIIPVYSGGYAAALPYGGIGTYFVNDAMVSAAFYSTYSARRETMPTVVEPEPVAAPVVLTAEDRAAQRLKSGDAKGAIVLYQNILKQNPGDSDSTRALGLALLDSSRVSDGIAVIAMAYRSDATLPERPIDPEVFHNGSTKLRQHLNRVSSFANKEQSSSAWFVLATLMQAEGRPTQALAMLERAKTAGIDSHIADELAASLNGGTR